MTHDLKIYPEFFKPVILRQKTFELRLENDRKYSAGDEITLREWDNKNQEYTRAICQVLVTYVLREGNFLRQGVACLGIKVLGVYLPFGCPYEIELLQWSVNNP